jgi:hypothetical protein
MSTYPSKSSLQIKVIRLYFLNKSSENDPTIKDWVVVVSRSILKLRQVSSITSFLLLK